MGEIGGIKHLQFAKNAPDGGIYSLVQVHLFLTA